MHAAATAPGRDAAIEVLRLTHLFACEEVGSLRMTLLCFFTELGFQTEPLPTVVGIGRDPENLVCGSVSGLHLLRLRQAKLRLGTLRLHQQRCFKLVSRVFRIFEAEVNLAEQESCRKLPRSELQAGF